MLLQSSVIQDFVLPVHTADATSTREPSPTLSWKLLLPPLNPDSILSAFSYGFNTICFIVI